MIRGGPEETGWREKGIHPGSGPGLLQTAVMRTMQHTFKIFWQPERRHALYLQKVIPGARPGRAQPNMYNDMERFEELKKIILERARNASACREQYGRAYRAENLEELMQVVRDNFWWACHNRVIDGDIVDAYRDEFATGKIWHNENITEGFLIASGSATVEASGSATVEASGSATVEASGSATVIASGSATVKAYGSATVKASGSATVIASGSATVKASGSATVKAYDSATVKAYGSATVIASDSATVIASGSATVKAYGSATVKAYDSATVKAYDSAYVCSWSVKECQLCDHAIYRIIESNTIRYVDPTIKFERVETPEK